MLNKVTLIGRVGNDPDVRATQDGREIANISIATSERWKDKQTGERKEKTEWHRVVVFQEGLVRVIKEYVKKGSQLYVEGALQTRKWTDQQGIEKYTTEVVLQGYGCVVKMLDSGGGQSGSSNDSYDSAHEQQKRDGYQPQPADLDDDIPF